MSANFGASFELPNILLRDESSGGIPVVGRATQNSQGSDDVIDSFRSLVKRVESSRAISAEIVREVSGSVGFGPVLAVLQNSSNLFAGTPSESKE
jgi:hypothetical protein